MSLTLPVTHPTEQTQTNLISMRFYLLLLYATYTSRYPSKEAETNLTPTRFFTIHSFMPLIFPVTQPHERTQTNLTFVLF